jgi:hypothetical protein
MRIENVFYPNYYYEKNLKQIFYNKDKFNLKWNVVDVFNDKSCIALYPFNGNINDLSGKYNGTWEGSASYTQGLDGRLAARLTGNNSINMGIDPIYREVTYDSDFSISFWIQFFNGIYVISSGAQTSSEGYAILNDTFVLKNNHYRYTIQTSNYGYCRDSIDSNVVSSNTWNFIALTYNNTTKIAKFYYNGNLTKSFTLPAKACSNTQSDLTIGRPNNGMTYYGTFNIQQLRLFKKELTQNEISMLYKNRC